MVSGSLIKIDRTKTEFCFRWPNSLTVEVAIGAVTLGIERTWKEAVCEQTVG